MTAPLAPPPPPASASPSRPRGLRPGRVSSWLVAGALALVAILPACGGTSSQCANLCDRRRECVDSTLDVDGCEDACSAFAEKSEGNENTVEKCDECLSQNDTCSDAFRRCVTDCVAIPSG